METLSDKIIFFEKNLNTGEKLDMMYSKDVKEFIRKLKDKMIDSGLNKETSEMLVNELAGEKLI